MKTTGRVNGIISNIVIVKADGAVGQNEICYVWTGDTKMMAEVIKVIGDAAYVQVFDSTRGLKIGDKVEFEGHMLEVTLAPGLLSRNYDGLQNDLEKMDGLFIARGSITDPIDFSAEWEFTPLAKAGDKVSAASWLGEVKEQWVMHKIMVPFSMTDTYTAKSVAAAGKYKVTDTVATLTDAEGRDHDVTMVQKWPVKQAVRCYTEKPRPSRVMITGVRAIDTFNPMAEGGTGFIPGPFGAGKTVLQHAISKQADADVIIMVACGERANEVVEIFKEFPELIDPRTGHNLMERTIIICNTSNMPVAAREASVYTGMTIGEYYRAMGLKVLVMADSTSRWAQALREMSNRLEELPGQDAFPMDLSAIISNFYSRAGLVKLVGVGERNVVAALLGAHLEPALHLLRPADLDAGGQQLLGALAERLVEFLALVLGKQGLQFDLARIGTVPVLRHGDEHLLDERRVHDGLLHAAGRGLGDDQRGDLLFDFRHGLFAGQCDLSHGVLLDILGFRLRLLHDLLGLGTGLGDDLLRFGLGVGDQLVGLGTAFLQPFVVELLGQLLQFVFHSVIFV